MPQISVERPHEELLAATVRHEYQLGQERIDVFKVAELLGLEVVRYPVGDDSIWGMYRPLPEGAGAIFINSDAPMVRQRFSAAHEIGHRVLHRDQPFVDTSRYRDTRQEREADRFAGALLIDRAKAERLYAQWSGDLPATVAHLVEVFEVAPVTAAIALKQFGLVSEADVEQFKLQYRAFSSQREFMGQYHRQPRNRPGDNCLVLDRGYRDRVLRLFAAGQLSEERAASLLEITPEALPQRARALRAGLVEAAEELVFEP